MKTTLTMTLSILATLKLAACNTRVDGKKVEAAIKSQAAEKNLELKTVTCPPTAPDTAGESFTCTAVDDQGTQSNVAVTVTNPKRVEVTWKMELRFEKMDVIGDQLESLLEQRVKQKVDVTCPAKNIFVKPGVKFICDAKAGNEAKKVQLTFRDDTGACDVVVL
jgi:hypothetical protein